MHAMSGYLQTADKAILNYSHFILQVFHALIIFSILRSSGSFSFNKLLIILLSDRNKQNVYCVQQVESRRKNVMPENAC